MEYTTMPKIMKKLEDRFVKVETKVASPKVAASSSPKAKVRP